MAFETVLPETETLTLPGGDTITIKRRLNTGELRAVLKRSRSASTDGVDGIDYGFYLTVAYLVDWFSPSGTFPPIKGADDNLKIATINGIDPDDYTPVKDAIVAHVARVSREREDAKKKTAGTPTSVPTSPLPSAAVGELIGSAS